MCKTKILNLSSTPYVIHFQIIQQFIQLIFKTCKNNYYSKVTLTLSLRVSKMLFAMNVLQSNHAFGV